MKCRGYALVIVLNLTVFLIAITAAHRHDDATILQVTEYNPFSGFRSRRFSPAETALRLLRSGAAERHFQAFVKEYGKSYSTWEEYLYRLEIFARNLVRAAEHQAADPTATHGVTQFSDLTEEEFEMLYTGVRGGGRGGGRGLVGVAKAAVAVDAGDLPEDFDWREKGAVTEVKMQVRGGYICFLPHMLKAWIEALPVLGLRCLYSHLCRRY